MVPHGHGEEAGVNSSAVKTTARGTGEAAAPVTRAPLSVTLPPDLRKRLSGVAKRRKLKVATTARVLIDERISEIEDEAQLQRAERWQLKQTLTTVKRIHAGDHRWVSMKQMEADARRAFAEAKSRTRRSASYRTRRSAS